MRFITRPYAPLFLGSLTKIWNATVATRSAADITPKDGRYSSLSAGSPWRERGGHPHNQAYGSKGGTERLREEDEEGRPRHPVAEPREEPDEHEREECPAQTEFLVRPFRYKMTSGTYSHRDELHVAESSVQFVPP